MPKLLLGFVQHRGAAWEDLPAAVGLAPGALNDMNGRVPLTALIALWDLASARVGDELFGLRLAQMPPSGIVTILDLAQQTSPDLAEMWRRLLRFQHLVADAGSLRVEEAGDLVLLRFQPPPSLRTPRHVPEWALARCLLNARWATGAPIVPRAARFRHGKPGDVSEHAKVFGPRVLFDQPVYELELDRDVLRLPIKSQDPALSAVMDRYAQEWLSRLSAPERFLDQVERHIYAELQSGVPSAAAIAKRLGLSERSFSRRLRQEGASYPKLVDKVRKELAAVYLRQRSMKLTEVAFLLGFSELSAFYRAHRRWTGMTPVEARSATAA